MYFSRLGTKRLAPNFISDSRKPLTFILCASRDIIQYVYKHWNADEPRLASLARAASSSLMINRVTREPPGGRGGGSVVWN